MRQGVALRVGSFSRLEIVRFVIQVANLAPQYRHLPALNKILETIAPLDIIFGFVLELRYRLCDYI